MPTFAFLTAPIPLTGNLLRRQNALLTTEQRKLCQYHSFGNVLMPDYHPCSTARLVSCYALFK